MRALERDGRLEVQELFELNLKSCDLAVLSACDTHLGRWSRGDEIVGMERAFLRAGVPTVVASLWKVEDAATSVLMEGFYDNLWRKNMPCAEALHQAKLTVLRNPEIVTSRRRELRDGLARRAVSLEESVTLPGGSSTTAPAPVQTHPAQWAAFVLSGDWR